MIYVLSALGLLLLGAALGFVLVLRYAGRCAERVCDAFWWCVTWYPTGRRSPR